MDQIPATLDSVNDFKIDLGNGLYMTASGVLSYERGPVVYHITHSGGGFPVKLSTLEQALSKIANVGKEQTIKKMAELQVPKEYLALLGTVGKIAETLGTVVAFAGIAVDILKMLGVFGEQVSAFQVMVEQRFKDVIKHIDSFAERERLKDLDKSRSVVASCNDALGNIVFQKSSPNQKFNVDWIRANTAALRDRLTTDFDLAVKSLLSTSSHLQMFNRSEHPVWQSVGSNTFAMDGDGNFTKVTLPPEGELVFDHRLLLEYATTAITSYLAALRFVAPEYRSTGEFRTNLQKYAEMLEVLISNMRQVTLVRTIFTEKDFQGPYSLYDFQVDEEASGYRINSLGRGLFKVGALDVCNHNDRFFGSPFVGWNSDHSIPVVKIAKKKGAFDRGWLPTNTLLTYKYGTSYWFDESYVSKNRESVAAEANAQSERDYAEILWTSGYISLVGLQALIRHHTAEHYISETVSRGETKVLSGTDRTTFGIITVAEDFSKIGVEISSRAAVIWRKLEATTTMLLQDPNRSPKLQYRVVLRTLANLGDGAFEYQSCYKHKYVDIPAAPGQPAGYKKLVTSYNPYMALSEVELIAGASDVGIRSSEGTAILDADTFDLWVPADISDQELSLVNRRNPVLPLEAYSRLGGISQGWHEIDEVELSKELRKNYQRRSVQLKYSLSWDHDHLSVTLNSPAEAKCNYIVFLVVEETLTSGTVLHTNWRIPINGKAVVIPSSFFLKMGMLSVAVAQAMLEATISFNAESRRPDPSEPRPNWIELSDLTIAEGRERVVSLLQSERPDLLRSVMEKHGLLNVNIEIPEVE